MVGKDNKKKRTCEERRGEKEEDKFGGLEERKMSKGEMFSTSSESTASSL